MELNHIREEIDQVDKSLRELFLQRMELSHQVAETKLGTKADVYVPKREQEVIHARTEGVKEEFLPECRAFFGQIMEIGRTYQYSVMEEADTVLKDFPREEKCIKVSFCCPKESRQIPVFVNAAALAGLTVEKIETEKQGDDMCCSFWLSGDFSLSLARAVIMQILKENQTASYTFIL